MLDKNKDYTELFESVIFESFQSDILTKKLEANKYKDTPEGNTQKENDKRKLDNYLRNKYSELSYLKSERNKQFTSQIQNAPELKDTLRKINSLINGKHYHGREDDIRELYEKIEIELKYKVKELNIMKKYGNNE